MTAYSLLSGLVSAGLVLISYTGFPLFAIGPLFAPLPLFLVGLGKGMRPLLGAALAAFCVTFVGEASLLTGAPLIMESMGSLIEVLGSLFLVHRILLKPKKASGKEGWYPSSFLIRDFTLFSGILMIIFLGLLLPYLQDQNFALVVKDFLFPLGPIGTLNERQIEQVSSKLAYLLPGLLTIGWMCLMLFNMVLAQGILAYKKLNIRPTLSLRDIDLPQSFVITFGIALLLSFVGVGTVELLGKNAALTLAFPFFLSGLGMVHRWFHKTAFAKWGLFGFYAILIMFFFWISFFVVFLGMLKSFLEKLRLAN